MKMKNQDSKLTKKSRDELLEILSKIFVDPKSELNFNNPFELLCAVVLSAQTTDIAVNKVTPALFAKAPDAKSMKNLEQSDLEGMIKSIGLYKNKAKNLIALSKILDESYNGVVPEDYNLLIKLPGVGSKTAKVVLNVAFGHPTVAVDTHIFRVCNRTGFCLGKDAKAVEDKIVGLIDEKYLKIAHHLLLLHGRYVCKAKNPDCQNCMIFNICKKINV